MHITFHILVVGRQRQSHVCVVRCKGHAVEREWKIAICGKVLSFIICGQVSAATRNTNRHHHRRRRVSQEKWLWKWTPSQLMIPVCSSTLHCLRPMAICQTAQQQHPPSWSETFSCYIPCHYYYYYYLSCSVAMRVPCSLSYISICVASVSPKFHAIIHCPRRMSDCTNAIAPH